MPAVVSDTSPLVYLTRLGHLDWLRALYGEVVIPKAVWGEVTITGARLPEAVAVRKAAADGWMVVRSPAALISGITGVEIDPGETEAISLAKELGALLIIDEAAGRSVARHYGLRMTGTAGVLLAAKLRGLAGSLKAELDRLRNGTNFRISAEIRAEVLRQASEEE